MLILGRLCLAAENEFLFDAVLMLTLEQDTRFCGYIKVYRANLDGSQVLAVL